MVAVGVAAWFLTRPRNNPTLRTTTATVTRSTQVVTVGLSGTLAPRRQADLSFSSAGTVTSVSVKVGQSVKKNQALAAIDPTDLRNAVNLAAANLTAARTQLSEAIDNDASAAQIRSARAQVSSMDAQLASAQAALKKAKLRSTIDGVVALVNIAKGDTVGGGAQSAASAAGASGTSTASSSGDIVVVSTAAWKVNGTVGATEVGQLKTGQKATVAITGTTTVLPAAVDTVGIVASSSGGSASFPVTLRVSGSGIGTYSGVAVTATVTVGEYPDVLTVPTEAIVNEGGHTAVRQSKAGQVVTTEVVTGRVFGNATEITSGLNEGDEVVIQTRFTPATSGPGGIQFGRPGGGPVPQDGEPPSGAPTR